MTPTTVTALINAQLDKLYTQTAGRMLQQIDKLATSPTSQVQVALIELDEEVERLEQNEELLTSDNPVLRKTQRAYLQLLLATQALILANASSIEATGQAIAPAAVTAKVFLTITGQLMSQGTDPILSLATYQSILSNQGVPWQSVVDIDRAISRFVETKEWVKRMEKWGKGYADMAEATIRAGMQNGWGPNKIAEVMRTFTQNIPQAAAENLTRTLQITAYREASLAMEAVNGRFIIKKIRIANLDNRTCLSCISLHGSELAAGQRVDDHYRGRCTEYYVVPGGAERPTLMQADSPSGDRRFVPFQNGEDWFKSLPVERQRLQASFLKSPGKWNAFVAGNPLASFVTEHHDDVFGRQIMENSIKGAFGETLAQEYYVK